MIIFMTSVSTKSRSLKLECVCSKLWQTLIQSNEKKVKR